MIKRRILLDPARSRKHRQSASLRGGARLCGYVGQHDHVLANPIISHKAERRPWPGEISLAVTKHDGVQVDSILIDQAKVGEALRQVRAGHFDGSVGLGLQLADCAFEIILNISASVQRVLIRSIGLPGALEGDLRAALSIFRYD